MLSALFALKNISPELYQEWKVKVKDGPSAVDKEESKMSVAPKIEKTPEKALTGQHMKPDLINPEALQIQSKKVLID